MLREDFTLKDFSKIFQGFNDAVYRGDAKKLAYKSWSNINSWLTKGKYEKIRVSKEQVRRKNNDNSYSDLEIIFVYPYDPVCVCPGPEELNPNDSSFGSWLDGVLVRESLMELNSCCSDTNKVAYISANAHESMVSVNTAITSLKDNMEHLQSNIGISNDNNSTYCYSTDTGWINVCPPSYNLQSSNIYIDRKPLNEYLQTLTDTKKENETMNFNFDFGPVDSSIHMSMYGMAVKNANGNYVAYDAETKSIMDVDILNFEGAHKFIYKMPVALSEVAIGDVVIHMRKPMIVITKQDKSFVVVDVYNGEEKTIIPARSPFGWDFMTKVVSLFNFNDTADASNPFGNMLPLLLLSDSKSKDDNLLPLMLMSGGNMSNPMLMWALMGNRTNDPVLLAMAMGAFNKQPTVVNVGPVSTNASISQK